MAGQHHNLLTTALAWQSAGYTPVPTRPNGSKAPAVNWRRYNDTHITQDNVRADFTCDTDGLGLVTGTASRNLEMLEVEGRAAHLGAKLAQLMTDNGFGNLWERINAGYVEMSPSGGVHWHYTISDGPARPNTKLACGPDLLVLIETRGLGGFTVIAPSNGRTHPTGRSWVTLIGDMTTIPSITSDERDALYLIAGMLDQSPPAQTHETTAATPHDPQTGLRPGDDYNQRTDWKDILTGWTITRRFGQNCLGWTRPDKPLSSGISATTGRNEADNLYVFSSSTPFEQEKPYSKFGAYALLHHHGDYSSAAKALRADGYGAPPTRPVTSSTPEAPFGAVDNQTQGNLATVTQLRPKDTRGTLLQSDDGNALELVDRYGDRLRFCVDRGRWYAWSGTVWAQCPPTSGVAREYAKEVARSLPDTTPPEASHRKRSLSAPGISAILTMAASDNRIAITHDQLDAHPWELNTPTGIVNLRTGTISPSDPAKLHTRVTSCSADPQADPTAWLRFLTETFGQDQATINYLQRLVGYSAIGVVRAHILPFLIGNGGNGKGVFTEATAHVLGGYATTAPASFLMAKTHANHETEIARLAGARMVLCSEVDESDHFDEARVKQLTGGDTITARFMYQDHFTFIPTHQLWLVGNHQPAVKSGGRAFWRRLRLIEFAHEVPADQIIDDLQGILATQHGPALLAWIIAGAVAYCRDGLGEPASVMAATAGYAHEQDTVSRFLEDACRIGGGELVQLKVSVIRAAYERWCAEAGEQPVTAKAMGIAISRAGIESKRTNSARMYLGISLFADENAEPQWDDQ